MNTIDTIQKQPAVAVQFLKETLLTFAGKVSVKEALEISAGPLLLILMV